MWRRILIVVVVLVGAIYVFNASWRAAPPDGALKLIAHRGTHQNFDEAGVENDTCTATRIREPIVGEIENTLPSMKSAFAAGADVVELDVHPTTDGQMAVFHDWTLDCRTQGTGETRSHDMAYLKTLDVGYGYTADGGKTFPLRGTGVGLMPELKDVLAAFPDKHFLVNFKSKEAREGDMVAALYTGHPEWRQALWGAYGGGPPTERAAELIGGNFATYSLDTLKACLLAYEGIGWTGVMPDACRNATVAVPINFAGWLWGWPNLFLQRFHEAGSQVILLGPFTPGDAGSSGIDTAAQAALVPAGFDGYVWTNEITTIAPILKAAAP